MVLVAKPPTVLGTPLPDEWIDVPDWTVCGITARDLAASGSGLSSNNKSRTRQSKQRSRRWGRRRRSRQKRTYSELHDQRKYDELVYRTSDTGLMHTELPRLSEDEIVDDAAHQLIDSSTFLR